MAIGAAVVVVVGVATALVFLRGGGSSKYPKHWDARVEPLSKFVADHRDLDWKHPVTVEFLSSKEYRKAIIGADDRTAQEKARDKTDARNEAGFFRAIGLIQGNVDLESAGKSLEGEGTDAFYSQKTKRAYVKGAKLTPAVKATLVHELTHALQDQHFDLTRMDRNAEHDPAADPLAVHALVEGDATRIQGDYYRQLSGKDAAAAEKSDQGDQAQAKKLKHDVPPALVDLFDAPYAFGGPFVEFLAGTGGNGAVDEAFRHPPTAFAQVWDPFVYVQHTKLAPVQKVHRPKGTKHVEDGQLTSVAWYELLLQRVSPADALAAVDGWGGDSFAAYVKGKTVCVDARFRGLTPADTSEMLHALQTWQAGRPPGTATVAETNGIVALHSCDPGPKANLGLTDRSSDLALPVVRSEVEAQAIQEFGGRTSSQSLALLRCLGNRIVHQVPPDQLAGDKPPPGFQQTVIDLAKLCKADPKHYPGAPH